MLVSRTRWVWWMVAISVAMIVMATPRRVSAQWRAEMLPGLRFGPPLRAGFALGVAYGNRTAAAQFAGPLAVAEAGIGGGRVSVGYLFAGPVASGFEVLGSALRTWGKPSQLDRNRTLAGGEVRVSAFFANLGVGVFRPVDHVDGDTRTRYFLNVGLGI
jgi:hypothetical protein